MTIGGVGEGVGGGKGMKNLVRGIVFLVLKLGMEVLGGQVLKLVKLGCKLFWWIFEYAHPIFF